MREAARTIRIKLVNYGDVGDVYKGCCCMMTLNGISLIPICMHCKRIRKAKDCWEAGTPYIDAHFQFQFTHSICPECAKAVYGLDLDNQQPLREPG